ncbi:hypothetical protein [Leptospira idonii]|uniref:Lipoprotein n=1 Tax=Leptospira idonii TaxID=1193500 RepID=A0A4R9LWT8_9LEPT|nr:hypothetical protein [Leptospira idonii]TGN18710.1 hypothetical protein EHS15_15180 [Leptospira idonii]
MRLFSFLFLFLLLLHCSGTPSSAPESYSFDRLNLAHYPEKIPPSIPRSFLPESAVFIDSSELRSGFANARESYLLLESTNTKEEIEKTLEARSAMGDWKLIQKDSEGSKTVYLFEGFLNKSMSVLVTDQGDKRYAKYFFKKQSSY